MVGPVHNEEACVTYQVVYVVKVVGADDRTITNGSDDVYYYNAKIERQAVNEAEFRRSPSRDLQLLYRAPVVRDVNRSMPRPRIIHQPTWRRGRWKSRA